MTYSDKYGTFFGRMTDAGRVIVLHTDGEAATRLEANIYPVGSAVSARYEHPDGIVLTVTDAAALGLDVEG